MPGFLCSMVGASFLSAQVEVLRSKKGITAVGDAKVSTAQSKFGGASAVFDGTGDYADVATFSQSPGDTFTFESWVRWTATPASSAIQMILSTNDNGNRYLALNNVSGTLNWEIAFTGPGGTFYRRWIASVSNSTFYHVALTKTGTTSELFVDGTKLTAAQDFGTLAASSGIFSPTMRLGAWNNTANAFNGRLDEVRISSIVRYTANFTPSTTAFVNDANTLLLIHADGTNGSTFFEDDNGVRAQNNSRAIGNAQISTARSRFGGSSAYFDGNGDFAISANTISFPPGQNFTVEFFVNEDVIQNCKYLAGQTNGDIFIGHDTAVFGNRLGVGLTNIGWNADFGVTLAADIWYHVAITRVGTTVRYFVDGDLKLTQTSGGITNANWQWRNLVLGAELTGNTPLNGYLDEVRISNSARYTANFTAPTAPHVNDANTLLLIHANGTNGSTVFTDDIGGRRQRGITAIGNAQVSTAQSQFGGASALFDGTDDIIAIGDDSDSNYVLIPRTGEFTWECWARFTVATGRQLVTSVYGAQGDANPAGRFFISTFDNYLRFAVNSGPSIASSTTTVQNQWYHLAVVRNSANQFTFYIDGVSQGSSTSNVTLAAGYVAIGGTGNAYDLDFGGYVDEFRISNTARYTANFTPSTTPFQNDANTLLLLHMDGTNGSTTFTDDNGVAPFFA